MISINGKPLTMRETSRSAPPHPLTCHGSRCPLCLALLPLKLIHFMVLMTGWCAQAVPHVGISQVVAISRFGKPHLQRSAGAKSEALPRRADHESVICVHRFGAMMACTALPSVEQLAATAMWMEWPR